MATSQSKGGCYCGNVIFEMEISEKHDLYKPRACDCGFCRKHGASYISDNKGMLIIFVNDEVNLSRYQQGAGIADFLLCNKCGVLVGVCYENQGQLYAAINSRAVDRETSFGQETVVSPKQLSDNEKIQRWQDIWFSDVRIKYVDA